MLDYSTAERAHACNALCNAGGLRAPLWRATWWTARPTAAARRLLADPRGLSATQRTALRLAWEVWDGRPRVRWADLVAGDGDFIGAIVGLLADLADLADGKPLHDWAAAEDAERAGEDANEAQNAKAPPTPAEVEGAHKAAAEAEAAAEREFRVTIERAADGDPRVLAAYRATDRAVSELGAIKRAVCAELWAIARPDPDTARPGCRLPE